MNSDYKHNKVRDPHELSEGRTHKMRDYVKKFFAKAHHKLRDRQKEKEKKKENGEQASPVAATSLEVKDEKNGEEVEMSDVEPDLDDEKMTPIDTPPTQETSPNGVKRKLDEVNGTVVEDDGSSSPSKRVKSETLSEVPAPPPPPPPPTEPPPEMGEDDGMMESSMTPGEDEANCFQPKLEDGAGQVSGDEQDNGLVKMEDGGSNVLERSQLDSVKSPTQLATPPSWTSSENSHVKHQDAMKWEGMNAERLQRLQSAEEGEP